MEKELKSILEKVAKTIRQLSIEAVQKANSGHPGLPLGCAEIGALLYGHVLKHNPQNPHWVNRDRFVLSAGHGSAFLYACLHLAGFPLSMEELQNFRKIGSLTPGHPEHSLTPGVEATTGPLGHGVGNAVGMALGMKILAQKFAMKEFCPFDNKIFCLCSDGCIMEGSTSEASSLAGHWKLDNLIVIYDSNHITLDGPLSESCSEDTALRYHSYGWEVEEVDGNDLEALDQVFSKIRNEQTKPFLLIAKTIIGKGSPHKAGTSKAHGSPLGEEELKETKKALGLPEESFFIPQEVKGFFAEKLKKDLAQEKEWQSKFEIWAKKNPELYKEFEAMKEFSLPQGLEKRIEALEIPGPIAGRSASQEVLKLLGKSLPFLYGGSADLSSSDMTMMKDFPILSSGDFRGRNIKYGVREFAMGTITNGLALTEMILPFCGTFLVFSDYMKNTIRLACLSPLHVIYQFTHDSIFLGEDGPTHQPVEHLAALRAIPEIQVLRPADSFEVKMAWIAALRYKGPSALILSRQNLPNLEETKVPFEEGVGRGAYILKKEKKKKKPDFTLMATGSEVFLSLEVAKELERRGKAVRVISFPSWEIFERQSNEYKERILGGDIGTRASIEAASNMGWGHYVGREGIAFCIEGFGLSAKASDLAKKFGFTKEAIVARLLEE